MTRKMVKIAATVALGLNLAAAYVIAFVWTPPGSYSAFTFGIEQTYLFLHLAIVFFASFLFGTIVADVAQTLIYTIFAVAIGTTLATAIITAPTIIFTEYAMFMDTTMTVAVVTIARLFLIGATFLVLGAIIGSFLGDSIAGQIEST